MYMLMDYRALNVYVCNNATISLHIHIFGVAAGMNSPRSFATLNFVRKTPQSWGETIAQLDMYDGVTMF